MKWQYDLDQPPVLSALYLETSDKEFDWLEIFLISRNVSARQIKIKFVSNILK